jgi:hypothetical protein
MSSHRLGLLPALVIAAAGCSISTPGTPAPASTTPGAAPSNVSSSVPYTLTAPHPSPGKGNDGTTFDPCIAYTAEEIRSWGVDPGTVEDTGTQGLRTRGCRWSGDGWSISQSIINNPVEKYLDTPVYPGSRRETIGGLDGVVYQAPEVGDLMCTAALPSQQGTVHIVVGIYNEKAGRQAVPDLCVKAVEVATFVVTKLPK